MSSRDYVVMNYRSDIDGLRGISVLAVFLYHLFPAFLPGGFLGVDVFFVISGYVVTKSILKNEARVDLREFYTKRLKRLFPALAFYTALITVFIAIVVNPYDGYNLINSGIYSLFGGTNFFFLYKSFDYFSPSVELNPFLQTWSLSVEEQFYIFYSIFLYLFSLNGNAKWRQGFLVALVAASFVWGWFASQKIEQNAFYMLTSRFWEMGVGAFLGLNHFEDKFKDSGATLASVSLPLIIGSFIFSDKTMGVPLSSAAIPVLGTSVLLLFGNRKTFVKKTLNSKFVLWTGKLSYSLYLWHWGVIVLAKWTLGITWWSSVLIVILSYLFATASYYLVELPVRYGNLSSMKLFTGIGLIGVVLVGVLLNFHVVNKAFFWEEYEPLKLWSANRGDITQHMLEVDVEKAKCRLAGSQGDDYLLSAIDECILNRAGNKTIYVFGNSVADHFIPMLRSYVLENNMKLVSYTAPSCGFSFSYHDSVKGVSDVKGCRDYGERYLSAVLSRIKEGDIFFLNHTFAHERRDAIVSRLGEILLNLREKKVNLILPVPGPRFNIGGIRCKFWRNVNPECIENSSVSLEEVNKRNERFFRIIKDLGSFKNLIVWNYLNVLCRNGTCTMYSDGEVIYRDHHHLTVVGAEKLEESFFMEIKDQD